MTKTPIVLKFDKNRFDISGIREIAKEIRKGKIASFPTETVYGIGGPVNIPEIEKKLREIKGRGPNKPFSYHIGSWNMLSALQLEETPLFRMMASKLWPGSFTLIVKRKDGEKIGIRFPDSELTCALINEVGVPFFATSANKSGQKSPHSAKEVLEQLEEEIDYVIDGGPTKLGMDSTVVDLTSTEPNVLRRGVRDRDVDKLLDQVKQVGFVKKNILVVCTGNSCRSPMAEGWLRSELKKKGLGQEVEIMSCGTATRDGLPPSPESVFVMRNLGIEISEYKSLMCRIEDVWRADLIITMSKRHSNFVEEMIPSAKQKIINLEVPDPIGMGIQVYEACFMDIKIKMNKKLQQILEACKHE